MIGGGCAAPPPTDISSTSASAVDLPVNYAEVKIPEKKPVRLVMLLFKILKI